MKFININNFKILFLSTLLVLSKYFISYFLNFDEDLFFKIIRLGDQDFENYALITESLSHLNLKTDWSNVHISDKIIGFPFLSLLWHMIFFNFFGFYSFIILEIIFYFLIIFLIFKIFFLIKKSYDTAFFSTILLLLAIELLTFLSSLNGLSFSIVNFFYTLLLPLNEFYGQRYPHPLVTSVYFFSYIYIVAKAVKTNNLLIKTKYVYCLGVISIFLLNSFFFHFIKALIFLLIFLIFRFKKDFFKMLKINLFSVFIYLFLMIIGFLILLLQMYFAEPDYFFRMGIYKTNISDKFFILEVLIKKLFQVEIMTIIFLSFFARYNYKKLSIKGSEILNYDLLFIFFISSLLSPYIFVIITNKVTHLYYFWSAIKFSGFLFIFAVIIKIFLNFKFNIDIKNLSIYFFVITILLNFYNNFSKQENTDNQLINDRNSIQLFLNENKYVNTDKSLFSDDYPTMLLWLKLKNKYLLMKNGFVSSYSDQKLENMKFNYFKITGISPSTFESMLNENEDTEFDRNNFAGTFSYKYSVNSIRHKKPIENEYSANIQERIIKVSPLVKWNHFFSNSEKNRLLKKYKNFKLNKQLMPNIIILKKSSTNKILKASLNSLDYLEIFSNQTFTINELIKN
tara:strand:+ start:109 stop:1983 length:1875 start_codon:yes stop_codon:yes gene_type:complete